MSKEHLFTWIVALMCIGGCAAEPAPQTQPGVTESVGTAAAQAVGTASNGAAAASPRATPVTYHRDIRPLLASNCVECHSKGGIGPSQLDNWPAVKSMSASIAAAVGAGQMPPWPADDACHRITDSRALPQASKDLFAMWKSDGYPEGDPADYVAPTPRRRLELGPPSVTKKVEEGYTPAANGDTYRCFFLGTVPSDTYVTALDLVPGVRQEVHHIQLHRVDASGVAAVRNADQSAAGSGFSCSSMGVATQNMFSYRPGALAVVLADGDAIYLKSGSGLILQVHYNTQFLPPGETPKPDQSSVSMWTLPEGKHPSRVIYRTAVMAPLNGNGASGALSFNSSIPANNSHVVGENKAAMSSVSSIGGRFLKGEVVGMTPHAHAWAKRMVANMNQSGQDKCLIDIPNWNFDWQFDYMFDDGVPYTSSDTIHVECDYDNTAANQPVINGIRTPVATITFGEKTMNEMCLHYIWLRFPFADFIAANH